MTELGHRLETFVVGELMKQASWLDGVVGLGHWRTRDGDEVDLVVERDDGFVVALQVKASEGDGATFSIVALPSRRWVTGNRLSGCSQRSHR